MPVITLKERVVIGTLAGAGVSGVLNIAFSGTIAAMLTLPVSGGFYMCVSPDPINERLSLQTYSGYVFSVLGAVISSVITNSSAGWITWPLIESSQKILVTRALIGSGSVAVPVAAGYGVYKIIEHHAAIGQTLTNCATSIKNAISGCTSNIATRWNFWRNGEQAVPLLNVQAPPPPPLQIRIMP